MIRINLLPGEYRKKAAARKRIMLAAALGLLAVMGIAGIYFSRVATLAALNSSIKEVERELSDLKPVVDRVNEINSKKSELDRKLRVIGELMETRLFYPVFMEDLAAVLPSRVWLTSLSTRGSYDNFNVSMSLSAQDNFAAADLLNALDGSPHFSEVTFSGLSTSGNGEDGIRVFSVTCSYLRKEDKTEH